MREKLYNAITEIDDSLVEKAESYDFSQHTIPTIVASDNTSTDVRTSKIKRIFVKYKAVWIAAAACICLVYGVGMLFIWGPASSGNSGDAGTSYMSYAGPVFPLSTSSDTTGVEVTRHTNWDFSPYKSELVTEKMHEDIPENTETYTYDRYELETLVKDSYVLTNTTDEDITLSLLYPFAASFSDSIDTVPQIRIDDTIITTDFLAGKYSGSYEPAWGDNNSSEQLNLDNISSWEGYAALLEDNSYFEDAQKEFPSLDIPITVYEYSNLAYDGDDASNPTFAVHFLYDTSKTTITGWGWNSAGWDKEGSGYYGCSRVYTPGENEIDKGATAYFITIGEAIDAPRIQGYANGGCDKGTEIEGITYDFQTYETTLDAFVKEVCFADYSNSIEYITGTYEDDATSILDTISLDTAIGYAAQLMYDDGILSGDGIERYDSGWLENYIYDYVSMSRVMYLSFAVTIPADSSIRIDADMTKEASMDFAGKNTARNGYDMATTLASPFRFTKQTASISNTDDIEILDQNFGFDIENGITEVELDINERHYWMDIQKKIKE